MAIHQPKHVAEEYISFPNAFSTTLNTKLPLVFTCCKLRVKRYTPYILHNSQYSFFRIVTRLRDQLLMDDGWIPGRSKIFLCSPRGSSRSWGPRSNLVNESLGRCLKLATPLKVVPKFRQRETMYSPQDLKTKCLIKYTELCPIFAADTTLLCLILLRLSSVKCSLHKKMIQIGQYTLLIPISLVYLIGCNTSSF